MSPPSCCLSLVTAAVTSSLTIIELSQSAFCSVEEKTYLRVLLTRLTNSLVIEGQIARKNSYVTRPISRRRWTAIALGLASEGAAVALTYAIAADKAQAIAKQIDAGGGRALVIRADSAHPAAVAAAVEQTVRVLGRLDILVNNAGIFTGGPLEEMTAEQADRLWSVNVRAVFIASQAAARHMGEGGRIITIGSALAQRAPVPGMTLYTMTKAALTGLTRIDLGGPGPILPGLDEKGEVGSWSRL